MGSGMDPAELEKVRKKLTLKLEEEQADLKKADLGYIMWHSALGCIMGIRQRYWLSLKKGSAPALRFILGNKKIITFPKKTQKNMKNHKKTLFEKMLCIKCGEHFV